MKNKLLRLSNLRGMYWPMKVLGYALGVFFIVRFPPVTYLDDEARKPYGNRGGGL